MLAVLAALAGTGLAVGGSLAGSLPGIILGIGAALIYSIYILVGERVTKAEGAIVSGTVVMLSAAVLSVTVAPAMRDYLIRGKIYAESRHPVSRAIRAVYEPFVHVALRKPKTTVLIGLMALASALPIAGRIGSEFMPPLDEGDLVYMPTTLPTISIEEARRQLQRQDAILRDFPEVIWFPSWWSEVGMGAEPSALGARLRSRRTLAVLQRHRRLEEVRRLRQHITRHLLQRGDVENLHAASVRAGDQVVVARMHDEIVHGHRGHPVHHRLPRRAAVERDEDAELGADEQQLRVLPVSYTHLTLPTSDLV